MNTKTALKKILEELLRHEYPEIVEVEVSHHLDADSKMSYRIYLGFNSDDFKNLTYEMFNDIRKDTRKFGKYVLGVNDKIDGVSTYNVSAGITQELPPNFFIV
jgi:hypothetical protein